MKSKEEVLKGIIGEARFNLSGFVPTGQILQAMEEYADQYRNLTPVSEYSGGVFVPCGEGDNICNCKNQSECGYSGYDEKCFHECPNCNCRCNCSSQPCSCCA